MSASEGDILERLSEGIREGAPVGRFGELLGQLKDVDARNSRGRTLLHEAAAASAATTGAGGHGQGWTEALLALGADPKATDDCEGYTVVELAEEALADDPEDGGRWKVVARLREAASPADDDLEGHEGHPPSTTPECPLPDFESDLRSVQDLVNRFSDDLSSLLRARPHPDREVILGRVALLRDGVNAHGRGRVNASKGSAASPDPRLEALASSIMARTNLARSCRVARSLFLRVLTAGELTSALVEYLCGREEVTVHVDSEARDLGEDFWRREADLRRPGRVVMYHRMTHADLDGVSVHLSSDLRFVLRGHGTRVSLQLHVHAPV